MPSHHTLRRFVSGFAAMALLATPFATLGAAPASAGAAYQKPKVGECRNLTVAQFNKRSDSTPPVACTEPHTAQTYYVGTLSKKIFKQSIPKIAMAVADKCDPAWVKAVGRSVKLREQSAYWGGYWLPSKAQRQQGARWFRCDITLMGGANSLAPLTATSAPFLDRPIPYAQRLCLDAENYYTSCALPHTFKTRSAIKLRIRSWPGKAKVSTTIAKACRKAVPDTKTYFYVPTRKAWKAGVRWVNCYEKTTARSAAPGVIGREIGVGSNPGVHSDGGRR